MATPAKNHRRIVTLWLMLLLVLLATGGVAAAFLFSGLPDPAVANRDQLLRWLVARDLSKESPETRLVLVRRLDEEFATGIDWESLAGQMSEGHREQLWKNIPLLFRSWLSEKAATYARLSQTQRSKFMDKVLKTLAAWQGADRLQAKQGSPSSPEAPRTLLMVFLDQIEACKRNAEPSDREQITQFVLALQMRALMPM
jgi:hypothetical protein